MAHKTPEEIQRSRCVFSRGNFLEETTFKIRELRISGDRIFVILGFTACIVLLSYTSDVYLLGIRCRIKDIE